MREYRFKDLYVGQEETFQREVTDRMMQQFAEMSGDENPLHRSAAFARERGYRDRVVYGMLTASLISTLGGVYLPGKYCLIQSVETNFRRPVFVGDVLTVTGKITKLHESVKQIVEQVVIINQNGEKVCKGTLKVVLSE